jgi:hypothetical protein
MVGAVQLVLGVARLGLVVNFLPHPVVNGFTNAAALIIATSQLSNIFGVSVESGEHHYQTVIRVLQSAVQWTHLPTLAMAVIAFAIMVVLRRVNPRRPTSLWRWRRRRCWHGCSASSAKSRSRPRPSVRRRSRSGSRASTSSSPSSSASRSCASRPARSSRR